MKKILIIAGTQSVAMDVARSHQMTPNECTIITEGGAWSELSGRNGDLCTAWLCSGFGYRSDMSEVLEQLRVQRIPTFRMDDMRL